MKNIFAAVGFFVIAKKGYEIYCEYSAMKRELDSRKKPDDGLSA